MDILKALSLKSYQLLFGNSIKGNFSQKTLVLISKIIFNKISKNFGEALWNILPSFFKSKILSMTISPPIFSNQSPEPVNLLGYKFYYLVFNGINLMEKNLSFLVLIYFVKEIIINDQYCAREFIKDNFVIVDAGANIGIFSLLAHQLAPHGKVYSFEPNSKTFNLFKQTIQNNNFLNQIILHQKALGANKKKIKLVRNLTSLETGSVINDSAFFSKERKRKEIFGEIEEVEMITIDDLIKNEKLNRVDFIKIDVEGYEREVIRGAKKTIQNFSPVIACCAYHLKDDKTEIPKLIKSINSNYKYRLEKRGEEVLLFWVEK